ncbi:membrane protein [Streptococcus equi subsp. equi]|nr:membrane protein [Streptococcus equi subsp. equi]CRW12030.1 membrane protein [Streptococcus equi subsp. equi]
MVGYVIQTTLLGIVFFLLVFMGYLNKVSGFSIIGVVLISGIVSWIYHLYLRKVE